MAFNHLLKGSIAVTLDVLFISKWESPYGFGEPHMETVLTVSIQGFETNASPFPYGYSHMETGIDTSPYGNG
jgi:hypothetical protein